MMLDTYIILLFNIYLETAQC